MSDDPAPGAAPEEPPAQNTASADIAAALALARDAQKKWRRYTVSQRVEALRRFWRKLQQERDALVAVVHDETGKPPAEIESMELDAAELILKYFTRNAHRLLQDRATSRPWVFINKRSYVRYVPRGVVGIVTPWNLPFLIPFGDAVPALLAGNAVLLKPSEWTPRVALFLADRFRACGLFPEGLLQALPGDAATGAELLGGVDMAVFTGSARAGRKVAAAAAERLIPTVLELGGKHPMIVARDAPLSRAAKAAVWGGLANCGQLCVGVERIFVEAAIYDRFVDLLEREMSSLRQAGDGRPREGGEADAYAVDLGRLMHPGRLAAVERHISDARAKGARIVGGEVVDRKGLVMRPALVLGATPEMLVMQEETFGPVLAVAPIARVDEGLRLANAGPYGLAASVWTKDLDRGEEWGALLESGLLGVNDLAGHYAICSLPFGGIKESGLGRRHAEEGLRMFCREQAVILHEWPAEVPDPWWFPYSRFKSQVLTWIARLT